MDSLADPLPESSTASTAAAVPWAAIRDEAAATRMGVDFIKSFFPVLRQVLGVTRPTP
jgi:hypothetical protein